ncbi:MAG: ketol-acid reductoisomerase [Opitutae bacterium]|nr:ketol-acid reductoisomerase [Opitutae bacterium]|tara:strand:+ start:751 stop:1779 length:1029 start_codon:yes stop_codon:yes gene_type:complete
MPAKVYTQKEAKITPIKKKTLAVIGYGSQGHAHALNLKDSGCKVIIGLYKGSKSIRVAKRQGFEVFEVAEAVQKADVIMLGVPDMKQAEVYENEIRPNLKKGKTLLFTHGFAIHFGLITPPRGVSVIMVAPKGPGHVVRSQFKEGKGVPALIAILKGSSKDSKSIALAWAAGVGAGKAGILETTFKEETETDLFGEQAVLCGGASALVQAGFETLVEAGYAPEMAYFECLHELKLIVDLMIESGIAGMRFSISETAKFGDVTRGPRVINGNVKKSMKSILKEIQSGKFAKEWVKEHQAGLPKYNQLLEEGENHPIEITGRKLRELMPWIPKKNIKGAQASYS